METQIALILILIISVILHEMAHGYAANWLGDPTARLQGRLSPNPLVHIDPFMSVILPAILLLSGSPFLFGAAKPVPYNPYNLTNQKWGEAIVAVAGPATNITLAIIFALIIRFADMLPMVSMAFLTLSLQVVILNLFLAFFNLVPIPPLDGSKILPNFLPFSLRLKYERFRQILEQNTALAFGVIIISFMLVLGAPLALLTKTVAIFLVGG
ncbi:hypothetical protein CO026_00085 [Candidatus Kaiserbacteria bacterium CG_4_9_14_0_2_um_filter_41_32]|uniref:Peptidase M50 domain-containing protein n=1 Tax=Candidatus Kaiserbacteria bacterium CG_4_9_14_0_2_um_filter_41_32 TaxID=1974601 RepID=A0A2M8FFR4_9BACT|nr:MAG: hypothetical protein CO026_00085 [Candidatus Kaiserbacteria bacterium CG_4_9_14_0_2_um_filter_41_32]